MAASLVRAHGLPATPRSLILLWQHYQRRASCSTSRRSSTPRGLSSSRS